VSNAAAKARAFQQRHHLTYPILLDSNDEAQRVFGVTAVPTNVVLDRQGTVRYTEPGFNPAAIDNALQRLMGR